MPARSRPRSAAVAASAAAVLLAAVLTGCSDDSSPEGPGSASATESAQSTKSTGPSPGPEASVGGIGHIHGLGVNPGDGRLYVATHRGVIAVDDDGSAERVGDTADYMGFTVAGKDTFLGSGHPAEGSGDHANRGLIRSTDAGKTWTSLSLAGKSDFHSLEEVDGTIYGYDSTAGLLRVSEDGKKWDERAELAALDIAVSPEDPGTVLATTRSGVARSTDGGKTFGGGNEPVLTHLSWAEGDALYGIAPDGVVHRSTDGGKSWKKAGTTPGGQAQALTAVDAERVLAATQSGVYESRDGGKSFTRRLAMSED
ncbi:F510_1955 family glycosylhydrolase [Streptomyces xinghaiensis]|uniref:F510_1955 family glycosylhydrolase n=1 Tax=Streptomyces xinghaiensis TaxID=1038928 RepID=UPI0002E6AC3E|nr:exo-alpha-sialidase [Streptomyces xinghaiensis]MZE80531.1 exo-alpha-sialidase [Streptomyces sp. SID5475]